VPWLSGQQQLLDPPVAFLLSSSHASHSCLSKSTVPLPWLPLWTARSSAASQSLFCFCHFWTRMRHLTTGHGIWPLDQPDITSGSTGELTPYGLNSSQRKPGKQLLTNGLILSFSSRFLLGTVFQCSWVGEQHKWGAQPLPGLSWSTEECGDPAQGNPDSPSSSSVSPPWDCTLHNKHDLLS
jgi:hypothetical protein